MTDDRALLALADKMAITEVIYTYGDCVDRRDFEGVLQCFHPDGPYQYLADGTPMPVRAFLSPRPMPAPAWLRPCTTPPTFSSRPTATALKVNAICWPII